MTTIKRAVILAGGKGTRLRPYTVVLPKPLMPIGDYPILEVVLRQLIKHGFGHITLAVSHQAEIIKAFFGDGGKWGVRIDYSQEVVPLGTMGPLNLIQDLPDHFLVMNGDILTDLDYSSFHDNHTDDDHIFTICSHRRLQKIDYGVLECDTDGVLSGFKEKPSIEYLVSMGVYMVSKRILHSIPRSFYGFDTLMMDLMSKGEKVKVQPFDGYWLDIGRPDDYMQAIEEFETLKDKFL